MRYLAGLMQGSDCVTVMLTLIVKLIILCVVSYRLIRQAYIEIALLYLHLASNDEDVPQTDKSIPSKSSVCFYLLGSGLFKTGNIYCAPCHIITCSDLHIIFIPKVLLEKSHKEIM